jgi:hypothetical protein
LNHHKEKRQTIEIIAALVILGINLLSTAFGIYNYYEISLLQASQGDFTNILDGLAEVTADTLDEMDDMAIFVNDLHNITRMTLQVRLQHISHLRASVTSALKPKTNLFH